MHSNVEMRAKKFKVFCKSQSNYIKFEDHKKYLDQNIYQKEFDNYLIRSLNDELYLQKLKKIYNIFIRR